MKFYRIPPTELSSAYFASALPLDVCSYARRGKATRSEHFLPIPPNQRELLKTAFLTALFICENRQISQVSFLRCPNLRITDAGPHINSIVTEPSVRRALGRGGKTSAHLEHSPAACIICYRRLSSPPRRMRRTIKRNMTEVRNELSLQSFQ